MTRWKFKRFFGFMIMLCLCFIIVQLFKDNIRLIFVRQKSSEHRLRSVTQSSNLSNYFVKFRENDSQIAPDRLTLHKNLNNSKLSNSHHLNNRKLHKSHQINSCYIRCHSPSGRLGNQMFAFASTLGIADTLHCKFILPRSHPVVKLFDIKSFYMLDTNLTNMLTIKREHLYKDLWKKSEKYRNYNMTILGYLHSWKYFVNSARIVRESLTIKSAYTEKAKLFLKEKIPGSKTLIGIHVRRSDFMASKELKIGRVVATKTYLLAAMELYRKRFKNSHFVVCSDDVRWCKKNIKGPDVTFSTFREAIVDMAILSMCNHTIITVGTFGWWGGWLAGGTVVYLSDYPIPGSYVEKVRPKRIYYPPDWIGMNNEGLIANTTMSFHIDTTH